MGTAAGWQLYARRTVTGEWLHTDVPASASLTWANSDAGDAALTIPTALDLETAGDGDPLWLERGTTLYAERYGQLRWVGLCSFVQPRATGRDVRFRGLTSALDLIGFEGRIRQWQADPFDIVEQLVADAAAQADGDVGLTVVRNGLPPDFAGDEKPPPSPRKPKRRRGESRDAYDDRLFSWEKNYDDWEAEYGSLEPYSLAWWEAQYAGEELRELALETGFEWQERHTWTDRDALAARHDLILQAPQRQRRTDIALVEGDNIAEVVAPSTSTDAYGNTITALGAGEGSRMRTATYARRDNRVRTTRYVDMKHVKHVKRLQRRARRAYGGASVRTTLEGLEVTDAAAGALNVGDEVRVESRLFRGWCEVESVTLSTTGATGSLKFTAGGL